MANEPEPFITAVVRRYLDERETHDRWVTVGVVCVFVIYIALAVRIHFIAEEVKTAKIEMVMREMETDSLKRVAIREMVEKYDKSLREWREDNGKGEYGASNH